MIRRLAQFWLCWQLLKKKGVKWTKSDFSLLLCIPAQNCKLDLRFSLSKNYRSFDFLSKHNISSELTNCACLITPRCPSVRHHARSWFIPEKIPTWQWMHTQFCKTICFLFLWKSSCLTFPTPAFVFNAVKGLQIWTLWIFAICIVSCPNISLVHHVLILSRSLDLTHHKLMRTRTYVKLHFRCVFSCRQVGSIYLMQGEFAESICF